MAADDTKKDCEESIDSIRKKTSGECIQHDIGDSERVYKVVKCVLAYDQPGIVGDRFVLGLDIIIHHIKCKSCKSLALNTAARNGIYEVVERLLNECRDEIDIDYIPTYSSIFKSPLETAMDAGHHKIADLLIEHGAKAPIPKEPETPLPPAVPFTAEELAIADAITWWDDPFTAGDLADELDSTMYD